MEDFGYFKAKLEALEDKVSNHIAWEEQYHREQVDKAEETHKEILDKLSKLSEEVSLAKHFLLFIKLIGYTLVFMLAFKFGDIKELWTSFFK